MDESLHMLNSKQSVELFGKKATNDCRDGKRVFARVCQGRQQVHTYTQTSPLQTQSLQTQSHPISNSGNLLTFLSSSYLHITYHDFIISIIFGFINRMAINVKSLNQYLTATRPDLFPPDTPIHIRKFTFGQSNPTYAVSFSSSSKPVAVLRKKPPGKLINPKGVHALTHIF